MINPEIEFKFDEIRVLPAAISAVWTVSPETSYFLGHFPGNPILPGVATLDATVELLRKATSERQLELCALKSAKFMHPITPGMRTEIELSRLTPADAPEGTIRWRAIWKSGEQKLADLDLEVAPLECR